jgi:SAM-dependent methyltransferase
MPPIWDERYAGERYFYGTAPNDFLVERERLIARGGAVLCLGEGEGRNAAFLASRGHRVVALDQSSVGLGKAQRLAEERGLSIATRVADLAEYRIEPGQWDAIVSIWCHLPSALRARVHAETVHGLRPGGVLLLESYTPAQLQFRTGGPSDPDLMPTLAQLREELAGLEFVHAVECEREVAEGDGHRGRSAVVQIAARRPG